MANEIKIDDVAHPVFGMTERRYRQLASEGVVPKPKNGYIDFVKACAAYIAHQRKLIEGQGSLTLADWKMQKTKAEAELKQIELKQVQSEVIPTEKVVQDLSTLFTNIKLHLRAWSKSLPPVLYGREEKEISLLINAETARILTELADGIKDIRGEKKKKAGNNGGKNAEK